MSIVSKFTVTPLLYACGALLLLALGLGVALKLEAGNVATANAQRDTAQQRVVATITERDAWKQSAHDAAQANVAATDAIGSLKATLQSQQQECARIGAANSKALTDARAQARDADRTLQLFTRKFQTESRKPDCARALSALEAACPALQNY